MTRWLLLCNDVLRLDDNPLLALPADHDAALALCILPKNQFNPGRASTRRLQLQLFLLRAFQQQLATLGIPLLLRYGEPKQILQQLQQQYQFDRIAAAEPTAPEEYRYATGRDVQWVDTNSLLVGRLQPDLATLPRSFTAFRQQREPALEVLPPHHHQAVSTQAFQRCISVPEAFNLSDLPASNTGPVGSIAESLHEHLPEQLLDWQLLTESGVLRCLQSYLQQHLHHYKASRNALFGRSFASFLSIPLSRGTVSVRRIWQMVLQHEQQCGQNESSYWLRCELLWREYFRHLQRKHPLAFFQHQGLGLQQIPGRAVADPEALTRWQRGETGLPFIDANMRLLAQTGWMSNRGRQNVASYLMFQLGCDWRHGAAWFEHQLLDYDVATNWGNWAYIAGALYSAPRCFNPLKQALEYDADAKFTRTLLGDEPSGYHRHQPYPQPDWPAPDALAWQPYLQQLISQT